MVEVPPRESKTGRVLLVLVGATLVLLVLAASVARQEYPEGSFLRQQRSRTLIAVRPLLEEAMDAVHLGMRTSDSTLKALGEPDDVLKGDAVDIWVFRKRVQIVRESAWLGLVPAGRSQEAHTALLPLGVKDGVVVHVVHDPHADPDAREALQRRWATYHAAHPFHFEAE